MAHKPPISRRKRIESRLGHWGFTTFRKFLLRKNPGQVESVGARLGRTLFRASKKHRDRALRNLELAFPELSTTDRSALALKVFEHYGIATADFLVSDRRTQEELASQLEIEGFEHLEAAHARGKGTLMITGHLGNWERLSAYLAAKGFKLSVVARDVRETGLNAEVNRLRSHTGTQVISRGAAARPILEKLRNNELVGILPDQNTDEYFIPFFGKPAGTVLGPGVLSARTGATVLFCCCMRVGPNRYRVHIEPPLEPQPGFETNGEGMMHTINQTLERYIRRYPEQWLWFHDRWKSARNRGML